VSPSVLFSPTDFIAVTDEMSPSVKLDNVVVNELLFGILNYFPLSCAHNKMMAEMLAMPLLLQQPLVTRQLMDPFLVVGFAFSPTN
jgi:hypothetical protein